MFVEGVLWIVRTCSPWRDLPAAFGDWNSVFRRFSRWSLKGMWRRIARPLAPRPEHEDPYGCSRPGCPVRFTLTAGQKGDAPQAAELIEGLPAEVVMADTAYDAGPLRQAIAAKGAIASALTSSPVVGF